MSGWSLLGLAVALVAAAAVLSRIIRRVTVFEYQHALRFRQGRFAGVLEPGSYWTLTPLTTIQFLEARPQVATIPGQEVLSADGVSLKVSLLLHLRISDPKAATLEAASYQEALYAKAQAALRVAIGEKPIEEVLESRAELSARLQAEVEPAATALGVELRALSIKDIMFPGSLKEAFSQAARAKQEGQAALERARGETAALRNLANAGRMLQDNPGLFQLRLLQSASEAGKLVVNVGPPADSEGDTSEPGA